MPSGPRSTAIARGSAMTAPFDVEYAVSPRGRMAASDQTLPMGPPPPRRRAGKSCMDPAHTAARVGQEDGGGAAVAAAAARRASARHDRDLTDESPVVPRVEIHAPSSPEC